MFNLKQCDEIKSSMQKYISKRKCGVCPFCGLSAKKMKFKDERSKKEFNMSGLCQACQDRTFV